MSVVPDKANLYRYLAWAGYALIVGLGVMFLLQGEIGKAGGMLVFLGLSTAHYLRNDPLPNVFDLLIVAVALMNALGWTLNLYDLIPLYEPATHFVTTAVGTLVVFHVVYQNELRDEIENQPVLYAVAIALFGLGLGGLWELYEHGFQLATGEIMNDDLADVMGDLLADALGALLAVAMGLWHRSKQRHPRSSSHRSSGLSRS